MTKINTTIPQHLTKVPTVKHIYNKYRKKQKTDDGGQVMHEELRGMQIIEWESHGHRWEKWAYKAESHAAGRYNKFGILLIIFI